MSTGPRRGEIWLVALGAARPGEPGKHRPVVVVSSDALGPALPSELVVVVPLSSSRSASSLRPVVSAAQGLDAESVAVCRAIRGVAMSRFVQRIGVTDARTLADVERSLALILGFRPGE